jgi:hypothetical protein
MPFCNRKKSNFKLKIAVFSNMHNYSVILLQSSLIDGDIFGPTSRFYESYEKDIARVEIYFKSPTLTEIHREPTMTWIGFFANLGGLFGLVLGMGIIFLFELLWFLCSFVKVFSDPFKNSLIKYFSKKNPKHVVQKHKHKVSSDPFNHFLIKYLAKKKPESKKQAT